MGCVLGLEEDDAEAEECDEGNEEKPSDGEADSVGGGRGAGFGSDVHCGVLGVLNQFLVVL